MKRERGLSMIELLVGLAIGSMVIMGAVFVYNQSRTTYGINETQARLQENARYALAILEADITLAGNYGFDNYAPDFSWKAAGVNAVDLVPGRNRATFQMDPTCRAIEERFRLEPIAEQSLPAVPYRGEVYARNPLPVGFYRLRDAQPHL